MKLLCFDCESGRHTPPSAGTLICECDNPSCGCPAMRPEPARARRTDRWTSWAAARSITLDALRDSQRAVYECFQHFGPMHHLALIKVYSYERERFGWPPQSVSGLRSRANELVDPKREGQIPLLRDSGKTVRDGEGKIKRQHTVWEVIE